MAVKVDLSGLENFKKRLANINTQSLAEKIVIAFCNKGSEYAQSLYGGESITVQPKSISGNRGSIVAIDSKGEKATIGYLEFGTGVRGEGSYEGTLPTQDITFDSNAYGNVTTSGWTYYYAYKQGLSQTQWTGYVSQAQMWKTARYLEENARAIINEVLGAIK